MSTHLNDEELAARDEFSWLEDYAHRFGIELSEPPVVARREVVIERDRISALVWGSAEPELVLVHGAGQNAHTFDALALALGCPLIAIDLPGHGHSSWRTDRDYSPRTNAVALARVLEALAVSPTAVIGMSLGGLSALALGTRAPQLVRALVLVDATPAMARRREQMTSDQTEAASLIGQASAFSSFEEILKDTIRAAPDRSVESLIPGVLHNAIRLKDGSWRWRYDPAIAESRASQDSGELWEDLDRLSCPVLLVRGGRSAYVTDDDAAELLRRSSHARVETIANAGHAVQSSAPKELAQLITEFVARPLFT